jgi:hypothetical protein
VYLHEVIRVLDLPSFVSPSLQVIKVEINC